MGNNTSQQLIDQVSKKYRHFQDTRTERQIELSIALTRALTELNLSRINNPPQATKSAKSKFSKEQFLYVYLFGTPPSQKQVEYISFPGQTVLIEFTPNKLGQTEQYTKGQPMTFIEWAKILDERINSASKSKPVILVFHSYGTYFVSTYFHLFPKNRVIGMVDIGGIPLTFFPEIRQNLIKLDPFSLEDIKQNLEFIFTQYKKQVLKNISKGNKTVNNNMLTNKYQLLAHLLNIKSEQLPFDQVFDLHQKWPPILKCFIYGRNDFLLTESLITEKVIHYTYLQKWEESYRTLASDAFERLSSRREGNVQERFVFSIDRGSHSLHMQKKNKDVIGKILNDYFCTIEEMYCMSEAKI